MADPEYYGIEYDPLRQFVGELSRLMAALLPVTRLQVRRINKWLHAPLLVTVFVRHDSALPDAEVLYGTVEVLRPGTFTVGFHILRAGRRSGFPYAAWFEIYIYDRPIPAGFRPKGHYKPKGC